MAAVSTVGPSSSGRALRLLANSLYTSPRRVLVLSLLSIAGCTNLTLPEILTTPPAQRGQVASSDSPAGGAATSPVETGFRIKLAIDTYVRATETGPVADQRVVDQAIGLLTLPSAPEAVELAAALVAQMRARRPAADLERTFGYWSEHGVVDPALVAGVNPASATDSDAIERPSIVSGRSLFQRYCTGCHGVAGNGRGPIAELIDGPAPANFTDPEFMSGETPHEFFEVISDGLEESAMPAWGDVLSVGERNHLVAYLWTVRATVPERREVTYCVACHAPSGAARDLTTPGVLGDVSDTQLFARLIETGEHVELGRHSAGSLVASARFLQTAEFHGGGHSAPDQEHHILLTLDLIAEEYADAVHLGEVVNWIEYGEALSLHEALSADVVTLTENLPASVVSTLRNAVRRLGEDIATRAPFEIIESSIDRIRRELHGAFDLRSNG